MREQATPRRHGRPVRTLVGASATLSLVIGAFAAYAAVSYVRARDLGTQTFGDGSAASPDPAVGPCADNVCNYLLLGSDSRKGLTPAEIELYGPADSGGTARSDTIMLVQLDPRREKAVVLSFPRDLWVQIPGRGWGKINTSFEGGVSGGGPLRVARTVHQLTGLRINHFLYVDLRGFQRVVDTIGGVEMCIPYDVYDRLAGLDLDAGCQRLDGRQALAYVRARHLRCDEAAPDLRRISRQQQFLRAVLNQLLDPRELVRAPGLVGPVLENLKRDPDLAVADLAYLVGRLRGISTGAVAFRAVPAVPDTVPTSVGDLSILRATPSARDLFEALRAGGPLPRSGIDLVNTPTSPANIVAAVLDDASAGAAAGVEEILSTSGFDVTPGIVPASGTGVRVHGPAIVHDADHLEQAEVLAQFFPGLRLRQAEVPSGWDVAVVVTAGYEPPALGTAEGEPGCIQAKA